MNTQKIIYHAVQFSTRT